MKRTPKKKKPSASEHAQALTPGCSEPSEEVKDEKHFFSKLSDKQKCQMELACPHNPRKPIVYELFRSQGQKLSALLDTPRMCRFDKSGTRQAACNTDRAATQHPWTTTARASHITKRPGQFLGSNKLTRLAELLAKVRAS